MKQKLFFLMLMIFLITCFNCSQQSADLVIINGKVVTVDDNQSEAEAIAVKGDKILIVGTNDEIKALATSSTKTIDVQGKLVIPGIIEGHGHFGSLGNALMRLNFMNVKNFDEIVAMVKTATEKARPGEWILGRGWHQEKWDNVPQPNLDGLPFHTRLSEVAPVNPVWLEHASGHSAMANKKAMDLAEITNNTPNPPGGEIIKDKDGNPIGHFRETAQGLIDNVLREYQHNRTETQIEAENVKAVELAVQECLENGITTFHDAGISFTTVDFYKKLAEEGKLKIRLYAMVNENNDQLREKLAGYKMIGHANNHLTIRSIKRLIDGALGAHGAWLLEPYVDLPSSVGLNTYSVTDLEETAKIALDNGFQLCVHAIGDRGNQETLNIFEEAFKSKPDQKDFRWRIEHSQHLPPNDVPRFGELGVIAAMQGIHCTSDAPWVFKRLGAKRAEEGAYVWQKLMKTGAVVTNGTDVPVEDINPIACYYATVTRKLKDGSVFFSDQKMSRMEALKSYTINNAYSAFEEDIKGSLIPGKLADITVLSKDILTCPDDEILDTKTIYTIVGGEVLYERK